jgi:predicted Zn finger-like uncharacterized protein
MLIVCPTCATSYMIDPASVGPSGRAVRCARCKATWFATPTKPAGPPSVSAFVDSVIAEAEADAKASTPLPPAFEEFVNTAPAGSDAGSPRTEPPSFAAEPPSYANESTPFAEEAPSAEPAFDRDRTLHDPGTTEPVTIDDAPPLAPPHDAPYGADRGNEFFSGPPLNDDPEDGASFAARRARLKAKRTSNGRKSRWIAVVLVLFAANVALIGGRSEIVRYLPQTASLFAAIGLPVNLRNLEFDGITISKEAQDGVNILIIEGRIVNTSRKAVDVPRLRFAARSTTGQEVYTWTMQPPRSLLGPGDSTPFTSRLAAPPANAADILVRFFTTQDASGGVK